MKRSSRWIRRLFFGTIGFVVFVMVLSPSPEDRTFTESEIANGEHCSSQNPSPRHRIINFARDSAKYPETFKRKRSGRSKVGEDGKYKVWVRFGVKNAFGVPSNHIASALVIAETCILDVTSIEVGAAG